jgi:hypothetical protein
MTRNIPVPPDTLIDDHLAPVARQLEAWRQQRFHPGERIPHALWEQAVALTRAVV